MAEHNEGTSSSMYPHYVYEYRDPRNGSVFYVGKGIGNRIDSHSDDATRNPLAEHQKIQKIREIREYGAEPIKTIIGRFETDVEALAVEAVLIKWVYGFDNLTNLIHGHRHKSIRPAVEKENMNFTHIDGIDRPRRPKFLRTGDYTEDQKRRIIANHIEEKLESISDLLTGALGERVEVSGPLLDRPQDPRIEIIHLDCSSAKVLVKVHLTGKTLKVAFSPMNRSRDDIRMFELWHETLPATQREGVGEIKTGGINGKYVNFCDRLSIEKEEDLVSLVSRAQTLLVTPRILSSDWPGES